MKKKSNNSNHNDRIGKNISRLQRVQNQNRIKNKMDKYKNKYTYKNKNKYKYKNNKYQD